MTGKIGSAIIIFAYMLVLFIMVRPGSQGPSLVTNLANGLSNVIRAGTGGGTWASALWRRGYRAVRRCCVT